MVHEVPCQDDEDGVGGNEEVADGNMMVEDVDSSQDDDDGTSEEVEVGGCNYLEGNEHDDEAAAVDNVSHVAAVDDRDNAAMNHMADILHGDEVVHVLLVVEDDRIHEQDVEVAPPLDDDDWHRQHSSMVCSPMVLPHLLEHDDESCWPTYHCCRQDDSCHLLHCLDDEKRRHYLLTAVPLTGARSVALTLLLIIINTITDITAANVD